MNERIERSCMIAQIAFVSKSQLVIIGKKKWSRLYLTQDLFPPGKFAKTISRNAHYVVAFKSPRDQSGMRALLIQSFPDKWREVHEVFNKVTDRPFGYMVLDFHPASSDNCHVLSRILKKEGYTHCYV